MVGSEAIGSEGIWSEADLSAASAKLKRLMVRYIRYKGEQWYKILRFRFLTRTRIAEERGR
jgi:hypothetical protein